MQPLRLQRTLTNAGANVLKREARVLIFLEPAAAAAACAANTAPASHIVPNKPVLTHRGLCINLAWRFCQERLDAQPCTLQHQPARKCGSLRGKGSPAWFSHTPAPIRSKDLLH